MRESVEFKRRNRIKKHFVNTSNVLLYCYQNLSDSAKITYQVIDGFDWEDKETGDSKGYAFPSVETIAKIRNTTERSIRRHIEELEVSGLLTRVRRRNKPSLFMIEDISEKEIEKYMANYVDKPKEDEEGSNGNSSESQIRQNKIDRNESTMDKNVRSQHAEWTKMSVAYREKENKNKLKENKINVNEDLSIKRIGETKSLRDLLIQYDLQIPRRVKNEAIRQRKTGQFNREIDKNKRDYLASEIADKLNDQKSLGCFRVIASKVPQQIIFEALSSIKETANEGKIKVSKGALFVDVIKGYCFSHGIELGFNIQESFSGVVEAQGVAKQ